MDTPLLFIRRRRLRPPKWRPRRSLSGKAVAVIITPGGVPDRPTG